MKPVYRNDQRGAVLVIALLFLTILTILGVTAMTATTYEERLAGNARDAGTAFQAAEAALRDARRDLNSIVIPAGHAIRNPPISGMTGFGDGTDDNNGSCGTSTAPPVTIGLCRPFPYDAEKGIPPRYNENFFTAGKPAPVEYGKYTGAPELKGVRAPPQYYIEVMCLRQHGGPIDDTAHCNFYRITGRGFGLNPNTQVIVQEIFLKM